jgi:outer membrane protein assembly factor BamB
MRTLSMFGLTAVLLTITALDALGADWPRWRGPDRTGVSKETGLLRKWPAGGPKLLWTFDKAGTGYTAVSVVGGIAYGMGARGPEEFVFALDKDGKELWATKIGPVFDFAGNQWSRGPNGSVSVDGDLIFGVGSQGTLFCVSKADGKEVWSKSLPKDLGGQVNPVAGGAKNMGWGYSWSPLVDGDKVIAVPGGPNGLLAALDKKKGTVLWQSKGVTDQATYSSPMPATIGGVKQYVEMTQTGAVGISAADGSLLWRFKRSDEFPDVVCPTPVIQNNRVYLTAWGGGSELVEVSNSGGKFSTKSAYFERDMANVQGGVVLVDKSIYGYDADKSWVCQDFAKGEIVWRQKGRAKTALKAGGVISADGLLFILDEEGKVGLVEASPDGFKEVGKFNLPQESKLRKSRGKVWTHPVLSDGKLYLRDQELIFCFQVK